MSVKMFNNSKNRPKSGEGQYELKDKKNPQSLSKHWRNRYDSTLELTGKDMNEIKPT
jgi:hypothetical protein